MENHIFSSIFDLDYLIEICNCQSIDNIIKVFLKENGPLMIEFKLSNESYFKCFLAPFGKKNYTEKNNEHKYEDDEYEDDEYEDEEYEDDGEDEDEDSDDDGQNDDDEKNIGK